MNETDDIEDIKINEIIVREEVKRLDLWVHRDSVSSTFTNVFLVVEEKEEVLLNLYEVLYGIEEINVSHVVSIAIYPIG